ncbi:hypothetical protein ACJX0J_025037 [Zea mays]
MPPWQVPHSFSLQPLRRLRRSQKRSFICLCHALGRFLDTISKVFFVIFSSGEAFNLFICVVTRDKEVLHEPLYLCLEQFFLNNIFLLTIMSLWTIHINFKEALLGLRKLAKGNIKPIDPTLSIEHANVKENHFVSHFKGVIGVIDGCGTCLRIFLQFLTLT